MYSLTIIADLLQLLLTPTMFGADVIDVFIGAVLLAYAYKRKLLTPQKAAIIGATFCAEAIPFVNAAPFWTLDLKNLYSGTLTEAPEPTKVVNKPLNSEGVRRPNQSNRPFNQGGQRLPRRGNTKDIDI